MRYVAAAILIALCIAHGPTFAEDVDTEQLPSLRDLDTHCPFEVPDSLKRWNSRAEDLRKQANVSLGLLPALELDPVQADIYGIVQRDNYTIEKVTFDSLPGYKVTGNLYRPTNIDADKKIPGILCPHGHWTEARFYAANEKERKQLLATGAERFESAAENHIQARCVQLARMGCVVFHWDMIGYCDNTQISYERAHRFANQPRDTEVTENGWLLFSPLAESHSQSVLGLQSLATQRAVDMLLSLPEVDPERIAITGASGGGTQSFIGAALDERISVAFPAVMVSTGMQGGCTCENASLLRIGSGNVEIAGLIAPRPLGLTAANDWTRNMETDGFPELQQLYKLAGAPKAVQLFPAVHFGHNFNHVSRVNMYGWMNKHLHLTFEEPILESNFKVARKGELSVWDEAHPRPSGGEDFERRLMKLWADLVDSQMRGLLRGDSEQVTNLAVTLEDGWRVALGLTISSLEPAEKVKEQPTLTLRSKNDGSWALNRGKPSSSSTQIVIAVSTGDATAEYEFDAFSDEPQTLVKNPRLAAAYTYGYNLPVFAKKARQLALSLEYLGRQHPDCSFSLSAQGKASALAAAGAFCYQNTRSQSQTLELTIAPGNFRFAAVNSIRDPYFVPSSARFWDLPGLVSSLRDAKVTIADQAADYSKLSRLLKYHHVALSVAK